MLRKEIEEKDEESLLNVSKNGIDSSRSVFPFVKETFKEKNKPKKITFNKQEYKLADEDISLEEIGSNDFVKIKEKIVSDINFKIDIDTLSIWKKWNNLTFNLSRVDMNLEQVFSLNDIQNDSILKFVLNLDPKNTSGSQKEGFLEDLRILSDSNGRQTKIYSIYFNLDVKIFHDIIRTNLNEYAIVIFVINLKLEEEQFVCNLKINLI